MSLQIKSIYLYFVQIPLRFSIEHALASRRANTTGFLVLTADDGTEGIGEFLARDYVMGESRDEIVQYLKRLAGSLTGTVIDDPIQFITRLWQESDNFPGQFGALGALDLALLDLWGKQCNTPAAAVLTPTAPDPSRKLAFSAVYPFASGLKLAALHFSYGRLLGMTDFKVKGSGEIERDLGYVKSISRAIPYPVSLRLDLNGSLAVENAGVYLSRMLGAGVRWFEQPFPKSDWEASARFQKEFQNDAILCADESVCSTADLERAIQEHAFQAINIRIGKNGGLVAALKIYERAVAAGLDVQLGALVGETSVLAFAGLQFAAAVPPLVHYEGCFGQYLIKWDLIRPSLTFGRFGHVSPGRLPNAGLVPDFDLARLERAAHAKEQLV